MSAIFKNMAAPPNFINLLHKALLPTLNEFNIETCKYLKYRHVLPTKLQSLLCFNEITQLTYHYIQILLICHMANKLFSYITCF